MKKTTIFKQLILNVIIPVVVALLLLGVLNYQNTKNILKQSNEKMNQAISDEIKHIMEFQDMALNLIEENLDKRVKELSNSIISNYMITPGTLVQNIDLAKVQQELQMNPKMEDIYIIDANTGIIVNTTFVNDKDKNVFSFGESFKNYLLKVLKEKEFKSERFSVEMSTNRIKKYTYQPTPDGKYILETGLYSKNADDLKKMVYDRFKSITEKDSSIAKVELFIEADEPFSLNTSEKLKDGDFKKKLLLEAFKEKTPTVKKSIDIEEAGKHMHYDFIYMERKNTELYKSSVIMIASDRTGEIVLLRTELIKSFLVFGLTLLLVIFLIYKKTLSITRPIKKLVSSVLKIAEGKLDERAVVEGNNEITLLSEQFNVMISTIESYANELEQKVKDRTAEILKQKEEIEAQKKSITDSIIYAKRIQDAILPAHNTIEELFSGAFVLYKPREIVSGDFYWVHKTENRIYIAAVDCTGHGVPGAFMSMLGYAFLSEIVNKKKNIDADEILIRLREHVVVSLRQTSAIGSSKDGMDCALTVIDTETLTLSFAGANNPLYIIRECELMELKADKMPIGYTRKIDQPFGKQEIQLQKNDSVYMFSDGYVDQFGGAEGWKFMTKNFKALLLEIYKKPLEEQHDILDRTIENWKKNVNQTDDILVFGMRI